MDILKYSISLVVLLKCVIASESVAPDVIEALGEPKFESIKRDWEKWSDRKDLFDYVVTKSVKFIAGFIDQVKDAKGPTLAALFFKRPDIVDDVLNKIDYNDDDLKFLTNHRPELAESHEGFFKAIDTIRNPKNQERAFECGVTNMLDAEKHILLFL